MLPDGLSIGIDSERAENTVEEIRGNEAVVSRDGEVTMIICNDGEYIYVIDGDVDERILRRMIESVIGE